NKTTPKNQDEQESVPHVKPLSACELSGAVDVGRPEPGPLPGRLRSPVSALAPGYPTTFARLGRSFRSFPSRRSGAHARVDWPLRSLPGGDRGGPTTPVAGSPTSGACGGPHEWDRPCLWQLSRRSD